jgi:hypothetical protein
VTNVWYKLDEEKQIVPCTVEEFSDWTLSAHDKHRVAETTVGDAWISTVFLGISASAKPRLFETMIFDHPGWEGFQWRYATYEEAVKGHELIVAKVRGDG